MKFVALFKKNFLSGLLIVIPLWVSLWIVQSVWGMIWQLHTILPRQFFPESLQSYPHVALLVNFAVTIALVILLGATICFLGWFSRNYLGKKILEWVVEFINKIPILRSVYGALDQLLRAVTSGDGKQFHRVVWVEYPRKGLWSLAFVTGTARGPHVPAGHLNVFVPTTPNPTSGFFFLVPDQEVRDTQMTVEEGFRLLLSLGIVQDRSSSHGR